jgi:hypothetical protein
MGAPPTTWTRQEQVTDMLHKAIYSLATGLAADRCTRHCWTPDRESPATSPMPCPVAAPWPDKRATHPSGCHNQSADQRKAGECEATYVHCLLSFPAP